MLVVALTSDQIMSLAASCSRPAKLGVLLQDEEGKINLTFPQSMKGFRDFLYFDEELQISIGNRGSLTIIKQ